MKKLFAFFTLLIIMSMTAFGVSADELTNPRVIDEADVLTDSEEADLTDRLYSLSEDCKVDIALVVVNDLGGAYDVELFTEDLFDRGGYGYGDDRDGMLFVVSIETRDYDVYTYGEHGKKVFTDSRVDRMIKKLKGDLSSGDYYSAFDKYATLSRKIWKGHGKVPWFWIPISLIFGAIVGLIHCSKYKAELTSVSMQRGADDYIKKDSFQLTDQRDTFLYKNVTKTKIESSSSSGGSRGGGGGSHHSGKF
ncbi:MAG: TPM domain-containing protein [Ruminococcus sp.]|nr:TPM domain-containing protein [Ruminococcus sp.]